MAWVFVACPIWANTDESVENVLKELDEVIANKDLYHAKKEAELADLKHQLKNAKDNREQFDIYGKLFHEYLHYQADSSLYYIEERIQLLPIMDQIGRAHV